MRRVSALRGSKDPIALFELGVRYRGWGREDDASEFGTRYPRERRLNLVLAAYLEEVEEIGCRGMDCDEVGGWGRVGVWKGGYR